MFKVTESDNHNDIIGLLRKFVPNYHINLFNPLNKNEFSTFLTDLQIVFGMLKYRYDKMGLHQYTQDNQAYFSSVDYDTCNVITTLLNTDKIFKDVLEIKKEGNDMCKALDDLYNDGIKTCNKATKTRYAYSISGNFFHTILVEHMISNY